MSSQYSFVNPRPQPYETIKRSLDLGPNAASKFDTLNAHVRNIVVMPGELIILGDGSTRSCTSHEAFLMTKASEVHRALMLSGGGDGFIHSNFEMISAMLGHTSLGISTASGAWGKRLDDIQQTLARIEMLYQESLGKNSILSRNEFITRRRVMFDLLDRQLKGFAGTGSGLRNTHGIRNMLGVSTNSYLRHGEITGYADRMAKVSKAASYIKAGGYIGVALNVAASGLAIQKACSIGREEECIEAKYVEGGKLLGGVWLSSMIGAYGGSAGAAICLGLGVLTGGAGAFFCVIAGAAIGGYVGGLAGGAFGEKAGQELYRAQLD
ncbi:hypothetical protein [Pseudomonas baltica]|uniref:hypothetical protein n=1 Tax=Pseudomonas baltica TaxID=2762576 RepID=UPI00289A42C6|nr:hypothetical protein [Pseudomonas baltica]